VARMLSLRRDVCDRVLSAPTWIALGITLGYLCTAGCGYSPHGTGSLPPDLQRLHLAALDNDTFRPGLQGLVGAAIIRRLQQDGRVRLSAQETADAVLAGTLIAYQNDPVAFERSDVGRRFRLRLTLLLRLTGRGGEKEFLKEEVVGEAFYTAGNDVVATRSAEEEATQRAAQDLAARAVARLMEGL
jgi:outer membrane lipopolysaccharide assembly protein LptE/RlpB